MSVLAVIAQVAATFLGFTGVIFAVKSVSASSWTRTDRNALIHLLVPTIIVLFMAFVPLVGSISTGTDDVLWRVSNALLFVVHAPLVSRVLWLSLKSQLIEPVPFRFVGLPIGFSSVAANLLVALGFLDGYGATAFAGGLVWLLVVATIQFVMLITPAQTNATA